MNRTVELVVHCFAEKRPVFASMLTAQLSSFWHWPTTCNVTYSICTTRTDELTIGVGEAFGKRFALHKLPVSIGFYYLPPEELFRRAIGRNIAFKASTADVCWAMDADYLLGEGCLDTLVEAKFPHPLVYPRECGIHRAHHLGDAELARVVPGELFEPDLSLFEPWHPPYSIGGLQIVDGKTARLGYLDQTKWTKPVPQAEDFLNTSEDKAYRNSLGGSQPIDVPGLYRCRHSVSAFEPSEKRLAQTAGKT